MLRVSNFERLQIEMLQNQNVINYDSSTRRISRAGRFQEKGLKIFEFIEFIVCSIIELLLEVFESELQVNFKIRLLSVYWIHCAEVLAAQRLGLDSNSNCLATAHSVILKTLLQGVEIASTRCESTAWKYWQSELIVRLMAVCSGDVSRLKESSVSNLKRIE